MKKTALWTACAGVLLFMATSCSNDNSENKLNIIPKSTRSVELKQVNEQEVFESAILAVDAINGGDLYFLTTDPQEDNQKASNLGNGRYLNYLKVTYSLTSKDLYKEEIMDARQVCISEMMQTRYVFSKEAVVAELSKILEADVLVANEKVQVNTYFNAVVAGVYNNSLIQFDCDNVSKSVQ